MANWKEENLKSCLLTLRLHHLHCLFEEESYKALSLVLFILFIYINDLPNIYNAEKLVLFASDDAYACAQKQPRRIYLLLP